jgi:putative transposase
MLAEPLYPLHARYFAAGDSLRSSTPVKKGKKMKQILKGNKARCKQYVMKNAKKRIHLDIVIDVKYLKGKRDKKGCENLGFVVFGINWTPRKVSTVYRRRVMG